MSQLATARPIARAATGSRPRSAPRDLRVVTAPRAGHGGLLLVCLLLLVGALMAVLLLNISMAKGTFALGQLQRESSQLTDTAADAQHALDRDTAPAALAQRALDLGMVPSGSAAFLRLSDGAVLGVAQAAPDGSAFSVVAQAPVEPARRTAPTPSPSESAAVTSPPPVPTPGTSVTQEGTITRTTVVEIREGKAVTTVTSTDSATGITTSATTSQDLPAQPAPAAPATASPAAGAADPAAAPAAAPTAPVATP